MCECGNVFIYGSVGVHRCVGVRCCICIHRHASPEGDAYIFSDVYLEYLELEALITYHSLHPLEIVRPVWYSLPCQEQEH